jgi:hypothetical protein
MAKRTPTLISLICEKLKFHGGLFPAVLHQHECVWYQIKLEKIRNWRRKPQGNVRSVAGVI